MDMEHATRRQPTLFDGARKTLQDSIALTIDSLSVYGPTHPHWAIAWSGGKDSTAVLTVVLWLIQSGRVERPQTITVLYADTRMELPPLAASAARIIQQLRAMAIDVRIVLPEMDDRFFVYMFGRGVPPPNNNTLRWCTAQIKVEPMELELKRLVGSLGQKVLMLTGVRIGESASRDNRIALSCGVNGAECGQGWFQETLPEKLCDTLAPILHWRVCHVWDWLRTLAPAAKYGGWSTALLADAYGGDEAVENKARTGCNGCPLAELDTALEGVLSGPCAARWQHIAPLRELRPLYRELRKSRWRLRKPGGESRKDGTLSPNQNRMGPLTMGARWMGLNTALQIQSRINLAADCLGLERIDTLNAEEVDRIEELIRANTWPNRWTGDEPPADEMYDAVNRDGTIQPALFGT